MKSLSSYISSAVIAIVIGVGGGYAAYQYMDTVDKSKVYKINPELQRDRDLKDIEGIFTHSTESSTLTRAAQHHMASKEVGGNGWDGVGYSYGDEDCKLVLMRHLDDKGNQASRNNTKTVGFAFSGFHENKRPSECRLDNFEVWMFSMLTLFPNIQWHKPHNKNPYSNTKCPSLVEEALRERGLYFDSREEILPWMEKMRAKLLKDE